MTNEQTAKIAKILGVTEDKIIELPDDIQKAMTTTFEKINIRTDLDKIVIYDTIYNLWQQGIVLQALQEVADTSGLPYKTLLNIDFEAQKAIAFEYMADSSKTDLFYELTNIALAVAEIDEVAKLLSVPVKEIRSLPLELQIKMCGEYSMEFDENSNNSELIIKLREMIS